ncbi:thioesterase family protein [Clostridiaceae bacterium M8S5]|nr:thioesterase family protein [Clostridiaceae bacterium M8S5]
MTNNANIRVRYEETDQMGIAYHSNYFIWFDVSRTEFLRKIGVNYKELEDLGVLLPVIDVGCKYLLPAKFDDEIIVQTKLVQVKGARIMLNYVVSHNGNTLATGYTQHAFVDKTLKPINLKKHYKEIYDRFIKSLTTE